MAAIDGQVYAVGGCDSWNCLSSVEVLDTELNIWRMGVPISTPRRGCGLAVFKGEECALRFNIFKIYIYSVFLIQSNYALTAVQSKADNCCDSSSITWKLKVTS